MIEQTTLDNDNNAQILNTALVIYGFVAFTTYFLLLSAFRKLAISNTVRTPILFVVVVALIFLFSLRRQPLGLLLGQSLILICALIYWRISQEVYILLLALILITLPYAKANINTFLKLDLFIKILTILLLFYLSTRGILNNIAIASPDRVGLTYTYRFAFGFSHPNQFGVAMASFCMEWLYLVKRRFWPLLITILLMVMTYRYSGSRTALLEFGVYLFLQPLFNTHWLQRWIQRSKLLRFILANTYTLLFLLSIYFVQLYRGGHVLGQRANLWFSGRLELAAAYWQAYGLHWWPKRGGIQIDKQTSMWSTLDNQYMHSLILYGVFGTLLFLIGMVYLLYRIMAKQAYALLALCIVFAIASLMESQLFTFNTNFMWLIISLGASYKYLPPQSKGGRVLFN